MHPSSTGSAGAEIPKPTATLAPPRWLYWTLIGAMAPLGGPRQLRGRDR
jgi:hypothetical protein